MTRARLLALLLCLVPFALLFATPLSALSFDEVLPDLLDAMPPTVQDELSSLTDPDEIGELLGLERLAARLLSALEGALSPSLAMLGKLLSAVLFSAVLGLAAKHLGGSAARAAECAASVTVAVTVFTLAKQDITLVVSTVSDMRALSDGLIPVFATLFASGGSASTAVSAAAGFSALSLFLTHAVGALLLPMLAFLFGLNAISALGTGGVSDGLFRTVKGLYLTLILFFSVLLVTSLGFQTTLTAAGDSLAAGSVRFAVGNLIPVVGGTLSGSLRTLAASLSLIRTSAGTLAVVALLCACLPVLISLLLHRLTLSLCADVSHALGADSTRRILDGFRGIYDLAIAALALALVLFFLVLGILCRTATALG